MNWLVSVLLFTTIFHWWFSQAIWQRRIMMNTNHECVGVIKYCIVILYLLELYIDKYPFHTWVKCHELGGRSSLFLSLNHSWGLGKRFLPFVLSPLHYFCTISICMSKGLLFKVVVGGALNGASHLRDFCRCRNLFSLSALAEKWSCRDVFSFHCGQFLSYYRLRY